MGDININNTANNTGGNAPKTSGGGNKKPDNTKLIIVIGILMLIALGVINVEDLAGLIKSLL